MRMRIIRGTISTETTIEILICHFFYRGEHPKFIYFHREKYKNKKIFFVNLVSSLVVCLNGVKRKS